MTMRKNVASQKFVFTLVNASTGAALTGATVTAKLSIDGGASATATGTVTELANGQYLWSPDQADTNGDVLGVQFTATNAVARSFTIYTIAGAVGDTIGDAVWDEVLTGATHNITNSAGRRLRQLDSITAHDGTAQAGTANSITLAAGASSTNAVYDFDVVTIVDGTGSGQSRMIVDYNGTSKIATVSRNWNITPDNTSEYIVTGKAEFLVETSGLAAGGGASSVTLDSSASSVDGTYIGSTVMILTGTGGGQVRIITGYTGATKVATVSQSWATTPDTTSAYAVIPIGRSLLIDTSASGATAVRAAVGLASANLDTQLADLPTNSELSAALASADDAVLAAIAALSIPTANDNADALLDRADAIETAWTVRKSLRVIAAAVAGKVSGGPTSSVFRNITDTKARITSSSNSSGDRTVVTLDGD